MKPRVLVTREVFDETLAFLAQHCEVESNQEDRAFDPEALARRLEDKDGVMCVLTDRIDDKLLARCPKLKAVANIAVGYNNIDLPACTARGVMATNTPGGLDDSTADLAWALILGTAPRAPRWGFRNEGALSQSESSRFRYRATTQCHLRHEGRAAEAIRLCGVA